MEMLTVRSQQPNDLQGGDQEVWESSEFQTYLATQLGPENYARILVHMDANEKKQSIAHFLDVQANRRQAEAREREQQQMLLPQNPNLIEIDPVMYQSSGQLVADLLFMTSSASEVNVQAKEDVKAAYIRMRSFLDAVQKRASSFSSEQIQAFLNVLTEITTRQLQTIAKNQHVEGTVKVLIPGGVKTAVTALQNSLKGPQPVRQEPPWTSPRLSAEQIREIARARFASLAEYGILTGVDRKKLGVASSNSVDEKLGVVSVFASSDVRVNIILSTRDADPVVILSGQLDDKAKGWLYIALENPVLSIDDLKLTAGPTELKAVCEYRVLNTVMCVMSHKSLTTTNAIVGQAPSILDALISDRASELVPRTRAENKNKVHECAIISSIAPKGLVALLVPEPLMGIAAQVAIFFARQGLQVCFYPVPLTTYELSLGGTRTLSYRGPDYNSVLANVCNTLLRDQTVVFHVARLQ
jgi:hypothetical protein